MVGSGVQTCTVRYIRDTVRSLDSIETSCTHTLVRRVLPKFWGRGGRGKIGVSQEVGGTMKSEEQRQREKERMMSQFEEMYEELYAWREAHPAASTESIGAAAWERRGGRGAVM